MCFVGGVFLGLSLVGLSPPDCGARSGRQKPDVAKLMFYRGGLSRWYSIRLVKIYDSIANGGGSKRRPA